AADFACAGDRLGTLGDRVELVEVDGNGEGADADFAAADGELRVGALSAAVFAGQAREVAGVGLNLHADKIRAQEALEDLSTPREPGKELLGRERDVEKEPDLHVGTELAEDGRNELEVEVVNPD